MLKIIDLDYSSIFNACSNGMSFTEFDCGRIVDVNDAWIETFGISRETASGKTALEMGLWASQVVRDQCIAELNQNGNIVDFEAFLIAKGRETPFLLQAKSVQINAKHFALWEFKDITESKRIEEMKNQFISTVSHELRTPLTSVAGVISLLDSDVICALPENAKQMIGVAHRNCVQLTNLINNLLDFEKFKSGMVNLNLESCPLQPLIAKAIDEVKLIGEKYNVAFIVTNTTHEHVLVNESRFVEVMGNLLSNAAKFSKPFSQVNVAVKTLSPQLVRIEITDHGVGISESFKEKIFQKFEREDSSDVRKKGGSGLGLAISKALVEYMNGKIGFESQLGQGSTFYLEFPIAKS